MTDELMTTIMRQIHRLGCLVVLSVGVIWGPEAKAQGPFVPPADQVNVETLGPVRFDEDVVLVMPPTGILKYESISIGSGVTVSVEKNVGNTPLYLVSEGPVVIDGVLDVSGGNAVEGVPGEGGPGGFRGGIGAPTVGMGGDAGLGPGGGTGAGYYDHDDAGYGSILLVPLVGGSGGGAYEQFGGGGGGGAILIASNTEIIVGSDGEIDASGGLGGHIYTVDGESRSRHAGSGGAVRLVAPLVSGTGRLNIRGGNGEHSHRGFSRIDCLDPSPALALGSGRISSWMEVDPFLGSPLRLSVLEVSVGETRRQPSADNPIDIDLGSDTQSTMDVLVGYENFIRSFSISVIAVPDYNPNGTDVLRRRRERRFIHFDPETISDRICYTDATGSGQCTFEIEYFPNIPMNVSAYVRSF